MYIHKKADSKDPPSFVFGKFSSSDHFYHTGLLKASVKSYQISKLNIEHAFEKHKMLLTANKRADYNICFIDFNIIFYI